MTREERPISSSKSRLITMLVRVASGQTFASFHSLFSGCNSCSLKAAFLSAVLAFFSANYFHNLGTTSSSPASRPHCNRSRACALLLIPSSLLVSSDSDVVVVVGLDDNAG